MCQAICRIDGAAVGNFVGRYPKALIGGQRWRCHILFTIFHGTARAGRLVRAALCNGAISLSLGNRAAHEKNRNGESRMTEFF
jgi:hypothetical protein